MNDVGKWLRSRLVIGTAGNHDLDSRYVGNSYDPREYLKSLEPRFPVRNVNAYNQYWAHHFTFIRKPTYRLLILNSCAYHGGAESEKDHGRISEETLALVRDELEADRSTASANLLLCHHHPQQHQELKLGDYDVMKNGQLLLELLGSGNYGNWLIIHSHKHHPKLCYAAGGAASPVIFSAGSLSVDIQHELQGSARNQFYMIRIPKAIGPIPLAGTIKGLGLVVRRGMDPAGPSSGLPSRSGFGCRVNPHALAARIAAVIGTQRLMLWESVEEAIKELQFVIPKDITAIKKILRNNHQIELVIRDDGLPYQIGRKTP